ncbi:MAG: polysaccharide deacetylase family protein, partial [Armatimonadota bacterium]
TRLRQGDSFACYAGADRVEPVRETATVIKSRAADGMAEPAVAGVRRVQVGLLSGKTLIEATAVLGTVPAPHGKARPRVLALTFDDGPHPSQTPQVLAILKRHRAKATFFVLGELVRYYGKTLKLEIADGHEIGLHSWSHGNLARMSSGAIAADMARCQSMVSPYVGKPVRIMRPPYGSLSSTARSALKGAGYRIVLWDVDTNDWRRPGADTIYSRIMNGAAPGRIVLCHDGGGPRSQTIAAIARAVPALQARGYQLVTVSQVLGLQSLPQGGVIVAAGQRWEAKAIEPDLTMTLDDQPLTVPEAPVEVAGQLMVAAKAALDGLRTRWQWNQQAQKLTVQGPMETLTLRLNSPRLEHQYGEAEQLPAPPVLYRGNLMMPLWVVLQASGATALYDPAHSTLSLLSLQAGLQSTKLGQGPPPAWGKDVRWQEYLKAGGQ